MSGALTAAKIPLAVGGGMFVLFGIWLALAPAHAMAQLGITLQHAVHSTDVRAMYGGLMLAIGGLCLWSLHPERIRSGLQLCAWSYAGIGAVRVFGMLVDGAGGAYLWAGAICETILALWCFWALHRLSALR